MDGSATVDELAHDFGLPVSTLRLYQQRGLLPPPERRGRIGYYGPDHRERLRLIGELQARGFSLAAIKELLDGRAEGRSLDSVLGLDDPAGVWTREEPIVLAPTELASRFPDVELTPAAMARVVDLGLVELTEDGMLLVRSPRFLEIGSRIVALGVPLDAMLDQYVALRDHLVAVAGSFVDVFRAHVWQDFEAEGLPAARVDDITTSLEALGPLAEAVVATTLRAALQDAADAFLEDQARALAARPRVARSRRKPAARR